MCIIRSVYDDTVSMESVSKVYLCLYSFVGKCIKSVSKVYLKLS